MTTGITTNVGEEFYSKMIFRRDALTVPSSLTVDVYNDGTDALSESSVSGSITTRPGGASWTPQTPSLDTTAYTLAGLNASSNYEVTLPDWSPDASDSEPANSVT